jgi:hypothetical protein
MSGSLGITEVTLDLTNLVASSNYGPVVLNKVITGGDYTKGTILGRITASGKLTAYDSGASDGSEEPVGVLLEDTDAASADVVAAVGFAGVYIRSETTGIDDAAVLALEPKGIYFK